MAFERYFNNKWLNGEQLPRYRSEELNRRAVLDRCVTIGVSPEELASTVDDKGVNDVAAGKLVTTLLERAHNTAIAQTLGTRVV